ncbi:MAG: DUF2155 domain-containing protein [Rhodospirillales bacterium]
MMFKTGFVVLLVSLFAGTAPTQAEPHAVAVLQTLDKVTARVDTIDVRVGSTVRFGTLLIRVDHCDKRPPEETPESTAFLEIAEQRPGEQPIMTFAGWMFASSPALNALEHPVYDVWLLDCKERLSDGN